MDGLPSIKTMIMAVVGILMLVIVVALFDFLISNPLLAILIVAVIAGAVLFFIWRKRQNNKV